jgi:ubiquinone/menaquinone biosynthesis C-methylase UbiE
LNEAELKQELAQDLSLPRVLAVPRYLQEVYWWAYVHPNAIRVFERQWLVNLILWGNYNRLRDSVFGELNVPVAGKVLQVACVYGDFTEMLARQLGPQGTLDVADVAPVQIDNLKRKINGHQRVAVHHQDSGDLAFASSSLRSFSNSGPAVSNRS